MHGRQGNKPSKSESSWKTKTPDQMTAAEFYHFCKEVEASKVTPLPPTVLSSDSESLPVYEVPEIEDDVAPLITPPESPHYTPTCNRRGDPLTRKEKAQLQAELLAIGKPTKRTRLHREAERAKVKKQRDIELATAKHFKEAAAHIDSISTDLSFPENTRQEREEIESCVDEYTRVKKADERLAEELADASYSKFVAEVAHYAWEKKAEATLHSLRQTTLEEATMRAEAQKEKLRDIKRRQRNDDDDELVESLLAKQRKY